MFFDAEYLVYSSDAPDFTNDPEMQRLVGGEYEQWRSLRFDLSSIESIEEWGREDRCYVGFYNGAGYVLRIPYSDMLAIHESYFSTMQEIQQAMRETRGESPGDTSPYELRDGWGEA